MKRLFYSILLILIGFVIGHQTVPVIVKEDNQSNGQTSDSKPYYTKVPANFFDTKSVAVGLMDGSEGILISDNRFTIRTAPVLTNIDASTIQTINSELTFSLSLLKGTLKGKSLGGGGWEEKKYDLNGDGEEREFDISIIKETDVDGDGNKEMIVYASTMHQHGVGMGAIINQEGKIIFLTKGLPNFSIFPSTDDNGFYTAEKLTTVGVFGVGGFRVTRYMHQDGKFIPVWTQDEYDPIIK